MRGIPPAACRIIQIRKFSSAVSLETARNLTPGFSQGAQGKMPADALRQEEVNACSGRLLHWDRFPFRICCNFGLDFLHHFFQLLSILDKGGEHLFFGSGDRGIMEDDSHMGFD
jgi:hypothetical protein